MDVDIARTVVRYVVAIGRLAEHHTRLIIDRPALVIGGKNDAVYQADSFRVIGTQRQDRPGVAVGFEVEGDPASHATSVATDKPSS